MTATTPSGSGTIRELPGRSATGVGARRGAIHPARCASAWSISAIVKPISAAKASSGGLPRSAASASSRTRSCSTSPARSACSVLTRHSGVWVRPVANAWRAPSTMPLIASMGVKGAGAEAIIPVCLPGFGAAARGWIGQVVAIGSGRREPDVEDGVRSGPCIDAIDDARDRHCDAVVGDQGVDRIVSSASSSASSPHPTSTTTTASSEAIARPGRRITACRAMPRPRPPARQPRRRPRRATCTPTPRRRRAPARRREPGRSRAAR